jgi:hypothetical protein
MKPTLTDLCDALDLQDTELEDAAALAATLPADATADEESFVRALDAVTELPSGSFPLNHRVHGIRG